jgi:hypothetical protein
MRLVFLLVMVAVLYHELSCQERPTKHARKKHRTKTTPSTALEPDAGGPDTTRPADVQTLAVDETGKSLSVSDDDPTDPSKLSPGGVANSTHEKNPHHHIPPPFIYASEKLNKTHATMFKR